MRAEDKAAVLVEALPYIQTFRGKTVVVKYGGHAIQEGAAFAQDVVFLQQVGIRTVVVHGGGSEISDLMERLGKKPAFVDGLRVTDRETAEIAEMVLSGKVNQAIVAAISAYGGRAVGLSGKDGGLIRARKKEGRVDLGYVGEVDRVDPDLLATVLEAGYIPVCAPIALGPGAEAYNLNADTAAAELAVALGAEKLILLTDVPGLLLDLNDPSSLVSALSVAQAEELLAGGRVAGGMIPKLRACLRAVRGGVRSAHIVDGRQRHSLLVEVFTRSGVGTLVSADGKAVDVESRVEPAKSGPRPTQAVAAGIESAAPAAKGAAPAMEEVVQQEGRHYLPVFKRQPLVLVRGRGPWVWDTRGRRYLDFVSGLAVCGLGHCHPRVSEAIAHQAKELLHVSNLYYTIPQARLAAELAELTGLERVFFANSGAEANEGAIKLARKYGSALGKYHIVTALRSFHGRTLATMAATGQEKFHRGFTPLPPGFSWVPFADPEAWRQAVRPETVAVMIEPVQGEGGIHVASVELMETLTELQQKGILLIFDEIQCGLGRTGRWFAFQHYGVKPDILTLAKSLGGGVPIGAVLASEKVAAALAPGDHGSTFGGGPLACAASLAYLEAMREERAVENAANMGHYLLERTREAAARHPAVAEVRGLGLMVGIELKVPGAPVVDACREMGLLVNCTEGVVIRLLPPLNVGEVEINQALAVLDEALGRADALCPAEAAE